MASKYYAVKKGKVPGIYFNWNDCKAMVDGYPGAVYKSFKTIEEAEKFINGEKIIAGEKTITGMKSSGESTSESDENTAHMRLWTALSTRPHTPMAMADFL